MIRTIDTEKKKSKIQLRKAVAASFFGTLGSSMFSFSLGLMLLEKTNLSIGFGLSIMMTSIVSIFLSPFVGPVVDKMNRKMIIIIGQAVAIIALCLYWFVSSRSNEHLFLYSLILVLILAIVDEFTSVTQEASKVNMVIESDLQKLVGYEQLSSNATGLFSSVMGALLYSLIPFVFIILIEILFEAITLCLTFSIDFKMVTPANESVDEDDEKQMSNWQLFSAGVQFLKQQPYVLAIIFACSLINFFYTIIFVGLPVFLMNTMNLTSLQYSYTQAGLSLGYIIGAYVFARKKESLTPVYDLMSLGKILATVFLAISLSALVQSSIIVTIWVCLLLVIIGFSSSILNTPFVVWLQKNVPTNMQGRVFHLLGVFSMLTYPIGVLLYGLLFDLKITPSILWDAGLFVGSGILLWVVIGVFRRVLKLDLKKAKIF